MNTYTAKERGDFMRQAEFLRGLSKQVRAYNDDGTKAGINMGWLIEQLNSAAKECEDEATYAGHMDRTEFADSLYDAILNNSNLETSEDAALFTRVHKVNRNENGATVHFVDGTSYEVTVKVV